MGAISREVDALRDLLLAAAETLGQVAGGNTLESEAVVRFLRQRCTADTGMETASLTLYQGYQEWAFQTGAPPISHKRFAMLLETLGLPKRRTQTGVRYLGIRLRPPAPAS